MSKNIARRLRYASNKAVPLAQNPQHKFAANQALLHMPSGAVYSFVPKNACSTLRFSLAVANGCVDADGPVEWIHANNATFKANLRELITAPYSFIILRCPFQRLVSVYLDKIVGGYPEGWQLFLPTRTGDDNPQKLSFSDFINRVTRKNTLRANIHWQPQVDFFVYKSYDDVFALEDFAQIENVLTEKIGFNLIDTRAALKHDRSALKVETGSFSTLTALEIADMRRNGAVPSSESLYTKETIAKVLNSYAKDIDLYRRLTGRAVSFPA